METILFNPHKEKPIFYRWATALAVITVFYNIIEGLVSVFLGIEGGTVSLFGFGVDSFVEVISGVGIWHMVRRMKRNGNEDPDRFEKTALKITGMSFFILTAGLAITSLVNVYEGYKPRTTFWGIVVAVISILLMWVLIHYKTKIGRQFNSRALLADAACSRTCLYLSVVLLVSSVGYELTGIGVFAFREGREAFDKAKGRSCSCATECRQGIK
jgi:divalent metal cation (Fe/Co/Zn/Cd) transporter